MFVRFYNNLHVHLVQKIQQRQKLVQKAKSYSPPVSIFGLEQHGTAMWPVSKRDGYDKWLSMGSTSSGYNLKKCP